MNNQISDFWMTMLKTGTAFNPAVRAENIWHWNVSNLTYCLLSLSYFRYVMLFIFALDWKKGLHAQHLVIRPLLVDFYAWIYA